MCRNSTGATTTGERLRINIKDILAIVKKGGSSVHKNMSWTNGANITYFISFTPNEKYLRLCHTVTDSKGIKTEIDYTIKIDGIASKLGKGIAYYFVCPFGGKKCRIIYSAYGSHYFKHRSGYQNRNYYNGQIASYLNRNNDGYWDLDKVIEKIESKGYKSNYKGKPTRIKNWLDHLREQRDYYVMERWLVLPKRLMKELKREIH